MPHGSEVVFIDQLDERGYPQALHELVYFGQTENLKKCLKIPSMVARINQPLRNQCGQTQLHSACIGMANVDTVNILLAHGANPFIQDEYGRMPHHIAANSGNSEILAALFAQPGVKAYLRFSDALGRTAFHAFFMPSFTPQAKQDISKLLYTLQSMLSYLSSDQQVAVLLQKDIFGKTPLQYAKYYGYSEILGFVKTQFEILSHSILDIAYDDRAVEVDYWGRTKLQTLIFCSNASTHEAREYYKQLIHKILVTPAALRLNNPNIPNPQFGNMAALHAALWAGSLSVVHVLLESGLANPSLPDKDGRNCLHLALLGGMHSDITAVLKNGRVDPNARDIHGLAAIHYACNARFINEFNLNVVRVLLSDPRTVALAVDNYGRNLWHYAAYKGSKGLIQLLLSYPILLEGINIVDCNGMTPLRTYFSITGHSREGADLLISAGAQEEEELSDTDSESLNAYSLSTYVTPNEFEAGSPSTWLLPPRFEPGGLTQDFDPDLGSIASFDLTRVSMDETASLNGNTFSGVFNEQPSLLLGYKSLDRRSIPYLNNATDAPASPFIFPALNIKATY